jgi:hypothetical protein
MFFSPERAISIFFEKMRKDRSLLFEMNSTNLTQTPRPMKRPGTPISKQKKKEKKNTKRSDPNKTENIQLFGEVLKTGLSCVPMMKSLTYANIGVFIPKSSFEPSPAATE